MGVITDCLVSLRENKQSHSDELYSLTYSTLRRIAAKRLRGRSIIRATELVHETWLRLSKMNKITWENSQHFYRAAAEAMRYALIDQVRRKNRIKRGAEFSQIELSESLLVLDPVDTEILSLNEALQVFELVHPEKAQLVKLKFFAGMTISEIAEAMGLSTSTVERHWAFSRAWLHSQMAKN